MGGGAHDEPWPFSFPPDRRKLAPDTFLVGFFPPRGFSVNAREETRAREMEERNDPENRVRLRAALSNVTAEISRGKSFAAELSLRLEWSATSLDLGRIVFN